MKVVVASHGCFPRATGGMERHTHNLAKFLTAAGVDVTVALPDSHRGADYPFATEFFPWPHRPAWLWSNHAFSVAVGDWIDRVRPDVALSQGFALWAYGPRRRVPLICHPHGLEMHGRGLRGRERAVAWIFRRVLRANVRHADRVVSLGGELTDILRDRAGVPAAKIVEIPNAVELAPFAVAPAQKTERRLLFVGRLVFNKGLDFLAAALARLGGVPFELTVIGDGPLRPEIEALAARDPRVRPIFGASEAELHAAYASAEALVFCSRFEGMPTVILEAMAHRCAVVASSIGAVPLVVDERTGIRFEPAAAALESAIRAYLAKPFAERLAMGERGRAKVEAKFSWDEVIESFIHLCQETSRPPKVPGTFL